MQTTPEVVLALTRIASAALSLPVGGDYKRKTYF
jgi:hypothetical protein